MANEQTSSIGLYEVVHRLKTLEELIKKIETDLYKGNGKSALIVRMEKVELNLQTQIDIMEKEAKANQRFREVMYADIQILKASDAFEKGKDAAETKNANHQFKTHHLIIGIVAMIIAPIIVQAIIHALHW